MASMVAKACISTSSEMLAVSVQEKGSRNKRKFRADTPLADPNKIIPLPQNECTSFEMSSENFDIIQNHGHTNGCDMCCVNEDNSDALKLNLGLSCTTGTSEVGPSRPREDIDAHDADWSDLTESQLEELILSNLDTIFKSAMKKIIANGYSEKVARKVILRSGVWYGYKDMVSNIVDNTLTFLRSGQEIDPSREHYFDDLQQMEKYILAELVCLLREVRPFFSVGDAMWCLLICDMNVSHACAIDSDPSVCSLVDATSNGNSSISMQPHLRTEPISCEDSVSFPCKPYAPVCYSRKCPSEPSKLPSVNSVHSLQSEAANVITGPNLNPETSFVLVPDKECQKPISNINEIPFSAKISHTEEKFVGSRKVLGISKREYILRQKSIHFEKHYRSKGTSRGGKLSSFSGLVLDKKLKAVADSTGVTAMNSSFKIDEPARFNVPQENVNYNLSTSPGFASAPAFGPETNNNSSSPESKISSSLPVADTELSLSFPAKTVANPIPISYNLASSDDKSRGTWVPHDRKDEMIVKLVPRIKDLQNQLQEWTEWANQKVMQAARRLSKDKAELKTLKQEKEEVERLKTEKQTLEESTMKKLSEMENALRKASGQVERANFAVRRLEFENGALRREMEAARIRAAESAASCREVSKREKKTLVKFQSWEKQKSNFQEDLAVEKRNLMQWQKKLQQAKDAQDQAEVRLKNEEKAKDELLTETSSFRKEREQIEASAKSKEATIKSKAQNNLLKYKNDIERLEKEISHLRFKTDSSKIAALRRGIDRCYTTKVITNTPTHKDPAISYISRMVGSTDPVKRERECVMCLSEEMSVIFLPCAHQVVCVMCNDLHEKKGMKDCPSCRAPIQRRVCVRFARS
ncbi:hypothetical protein BUALT_Bualt12G0127100 [Buddleja alternifolia]|uniref:RING-type domain-containing protein n=1 Tax=Buddleja alternifolia TaxID=168488 RepID=A0AAV6WPQ8_9LAMI|nr:hypothetical protein BUALT_Bualt12G0127100 [Buddleja alternifolia]